MLRMTTGYVFMVCFFSLFMIFIVGIVNESEEFQTVEQALEEGIKIEIEIDELRVIGGGDVDLCKEIILSTTTVCN